MYLVLSALLGLAISFNMSPHQLTSLFGYKKIVSKKVQGKLEPVVAHIHKLLMLIGVGKIGLGRLVEEKTSF